MCCSHGQAGQSEGTPAALPSKPLGPAPLTWGSMHASQGGKGSSCPDACTTCTAPVSDSHLGDIGGRAFRDELIKGVAVVQHLAGDLRGLAPGGVGKGNRADR